MGLGSLEECSDFQKCAEGLVAILNLTLNYMDRRNCVDCFVVLAYLRGGAVQRCALRQLHMPAFTRGQCDPTLQCCCNGATLDIELPLW